MEKLYLIILILKVAAEKMDAARMLDFIEENKIETIVDF